MILLSRLNGTELGLNADLIERVESTPDTVLTLIDGTKYVVSEPVREVVARIIEFRARIIATADEFAGHAPHQPMPLQLVTDPVVGRDRAVGDQEH
jgi:flagellar protein FlbD